MAYAAPLPGDIDLMRERQERLLQEQQKRLQELQQLPGAAPNKIEATAAPNGQCVQINTIRLQGASRLKPKESAALFSPFLQRCLTAVELNQILQSVTDYYLDKGFITTRAYLPQQDLSTGELIIQVFEGKVEEIKSGDKVTDAELSMISAFKVGDILNIRALEQSLDQINRLPSRQVKFDLQPGENVGGSQVVFNGEKTKPWRVGLNRHNDGQRNTGQQQWGVSLGWDSPLGLADQFNIRGSQDVAGEKFKHSASHGLSYSLPAGWWTFNYSYNHSYYRTLTQGNGFSFMLDGVTTTQAINAERVLHRDSVSKTAISFGLSHLNASNYLDNTRLDVSSQRLTEQQIGINHGRRVGNAFVNVDFGYQRGIGALDAQRKSPSYSWTPQSRYKKYTLTASYLHPFQLFNENFNFESVLSAQRSEDVLFSPQRFSIGGLYSVRGFKDQSVTGDSGYYLRNQIRWTRPVLWEPLRPFIQEYSLATAYDMGSIRSDKYNNEQSGRLSSYAFELSARGANFALSLTSAHSLSRPSAIEKKEHPVYFRFDVFF